MCLSWLIVAALAAPLSEEPPPAPAAPAEEAASEGDTPDEGEPEIFLIPTVEPLGSVVERIEAEERTLLRGRFGFRPTVAVLLATEAQVAAGARLGGGFTHHWWTVPQRGLTWSGETEVGAAGIVGGVRGWDAELSSTAGPWLGPVSLRLGPVLRGDSVGVPVRGVQLDPAFLIGFRGTMTVDAGVMMLWAGASPVWVVAGSRAAGPAPGVTELDIDAGLTGRIRAGPLLRVQVGLGSRTRLTAIGPLVDLHLVLHMSLGAP